MRSKVISKCLILVFMLCACDQQPINEESLPSQSKVAAEFVGSQVCANCHQQAFQDWQGSHHFQSMLEASHESVLADFSNVEFVAHGVTYRFYTQQENDSLSYWVEITETNSKRDLHQITFTFGFQPLQQYLVEFDNGHIQALNVAWDSRSEQEGGQRWFHLRPDEAMTADNIFHWQRHYQNWNSRCADCHSTGLQKNYNSAAHSYNTQWSEVNVACEACHGAGGEHLRIIEKNEIKDGVSGFATSKQTSLDWYFREDAHIASSLATDQMQSNEIDMCGACHSLRSSLSQDDVIDNYHDSHRIQIIDDNAYFPDGQIKQEVFVLGSFLQSKMHASGVTCANCHNPHSGEVLIEGNGLCLQCHSATAYDSEDHHQHTIASAGAQCVNCHMPDRVYMEVDARRDHSFVIPNAQISSLLSTPNPCLACHQEQDQEWLKDNIKTNSSSANWSLMRQSALNGEDVVADIREYFKLNQPVMRRSALLSSLAAAPTQQSFDFAKQQLDSADALIRRAALSSMADMPISVILPNALKLISDPVRSVRFEALSLLLPNYQQLSDLDKQNIADVIAEYRQSLELNADSPEGQLAMANFAISQLDFDQAEQAFQQAYNIEPNSIPVLINFADFYRATNRDNQGRAFLEKAVALEPQHSGANFAYAMLLIRVQEKQAAMRYLETSTQQPDSSPYYHYVYAVGLNDNGQLEQARSVVTLALEKWPMDQALLELSGQLRQ